jgi:phosphoribosylanthranilate isomerase
MSRAPLVDPIQAKAIVEALAGRVTTVGVFVNRKAEDVERIAEACGLDLIQLHGDETAEYCRCFPPERIIKAVWPESEDFQRLEDYDVRAFLADARDAGRYGGTGKRADWNWRPRSPESIPDPCRRARRGEHRRGTGRGFTVAVDINSGCEKKPGIKDPERSGASSPLFAEPGPLGLGRFSQPGERKDGEITLAHRAGKVIKERKRDMMTKRQPDRRGHFGSSVALRGRDADAALVELERHTGGQAGPCIQEAFAALFWNTAGVRPPLRGAPTRRGPGWGEGLPEAGGHEPHRVPQNQQHPRAVSPGPADGQEEGDRRNGAGQHGVATATAAALFGMECRIFMGEEDIGGRPTTSIG